MPSSSATVQFSTRHCSTASLRTRGLRTMTRLTPLQLVALATAGVLAYGTSSIVLLLLPQSAHRQWMHIAFLPMLLGMTLILGADWALRRGLSRERYTSDQLDSAGRWVDRGVFRWSIRCSVICGIVGALYSISTRPSLAPFFITLVTFSLSLSSARTRLADGAERGADSSVQRLHIADH